MPIGLTNAPEMFMQTMNNLFEDMLDQGVVVFLDDMLIYSTMSEGHFKNFRESIHTPAKIQILLQAEEVQLPTMDHHLPRIRHLPRRTTN